MSQLGLHFGLHAPLLLSNFVGAQNQQIVDFIGQLLPPHKDANKGANKDVNSATVVYISGAKSSGKTHLLQGCARAALMQNLRAIYLDCRHNPPSQTWEDLALADWVCLDNIECLSLKQQQNLFNFYNHQAHTSHQLILSSSVIPSELTGLNDLKTRLALAVNFSLERLSDATKKRIIQRKMAVRNLIITDQIYGYLFAHYSRDLAVLLGAIEALDTASLQQKHAITLPFVKRILAI